MMALSLPAVTVMRVLSEELSLRGSQTWALAADSCFLRSSIWAFCAWIIRIFASTSFLTV